MKNKETDYPYFTEAAIKDAENPIYLSFHIGRGGHFHNPGHLTFIGEEDFQDIQNNFWESLTRKSHDENDNELPAEQWTLCTDTGTLLLEGKESIEAKTGTLEFDGIYNTYYAKTFSELNERELDVVWKVYEDEVEYMSEELINRLCFAKGLMRVQPSVNNRYFYEIEWEDDNHLSMYCRGYHPEHGNRMWSGAYTLDVTGQYGMYTKEEWEEKLADLGFCHVSIEHILEELDCTNSEDIEFFKED